MALSQNDLDWFAARLLVAVYDTNVEHRMAVQVQALADVVRKAKLAIAQASDSATRLQGTAQRVVDRVNQVEAMTAELSQAEADLTDALGLITNGGPAGPLPDTPAVSVEGIAASIVAVDQANAAT